MERKGRLDGAGKVGNEEVEKKKYIERESSDQTALIRRWWWGVGGVGVDVCIQLRADSSYANTANFLFYFISGAEICDLR